MNMTAVRPCLSSSSCWGRRATDTGSGRIKVARKDMNCAIAGTGAEGPRLTLAALALVAVVAKLHGQLDDDPHANRDQAARADPRHDLRTSTMSDVIGCGMGWWTHR